MKVNFINIYKPNTYNNLSDATPNQMGNIAISKDNTSFTAKIPSIVHPTMEDLINRTKATDILRYNILRLAKFKIPCPVCGHTMLDVESFHKFEEKVMSTTDPGELLDCVEELREYLHPVEASMYKMMRDMHYLNPKMTILEMLKRKLPISERKIIQEQARIFTNLSQLSNKLPNIKTKLKVQELINETYGRILDPRETSRFSRKIFINKLKEALELVPQGTRKNSPLDYRISYMSLQNKIMEEAIKLPTAYNNKDAFIVKYAKRNYSNKNADQKIILRMLSNSLATVEHIRA